MIILLIVLTFGIVSALVSLLLMSLADLDDARSWYRSVKWGIYHDKAMKTNLCSAIHTMEVFYERKR